MVFGKIDKVCLRKFVMAVDDGSDEKFRVGSQLDSQEHQTGQGENIEDVRFKDYYVISREFVAEKEKGVGVLGALSEDVFNSLFLVGVKFCQPV